MRGPRHLRLQFLALVLSHAYLANAQSVPAIDARKFFDPSVKCDKDNPISIDVPSGAELSFDARYNGDYQLRGCSLFIHAAVASLAGRVVISSYASDFAPPTSGVIPPTAD